MFDRFSDRKGDLIVGVAVTLLVFVWDALVLAIQGPVPGALAEPLAWAVTVVACAALFVRSTYPLTVTVVTLTCTVIYYPASSLDGPTMATFAIALYTLAAQGRIVAAWITVGLTFLVLIVPELLSGFVHVTFIESLLLSGWFVALVALGSMVSHYRAYRSESEIAVREAQRRSVAEERLRIARELHDAVGHHLSLINVQAAAALRKLDRAPDHDTSGTLKIVSETSQMSLRELRAMVGVLREAGEGSPTGPGPSLGQLPSLVNAARAGGLDVAFTQDGTAELPATVDAAAYRVVQESLTNVVRHAQAERAEVQVVIGTSTLAVRIADDGKAKAGKVLPGNGMAGMRERAESLGGTFDAGPREEGGFFVEATWPLEVER
ncbi:sensor histidine kinase [Glycomyces salinus]|uniref:sensor histidine kinase n=1 Tax=Glycomyces salinus TaxID=980294 RepID=UPI0018EC9D7F|nr:sensor histidine kinase [Glycomyces salinus]